MIKNSNIWDTYREAINRNCTDEFVAKTSLSYWQNRLFAASIFYLIPLSVIAILPGVYMAYISDLHLVIAVDFLSIVTVLAVAFLPGMSVFIRKLLFNGVLYLISAVLLIYLGSFGPGLLYLLGISIFVVLSLDKKYGYFAIALNTLICVGIGFSIYFEWGNFIILQEYNLDEWIAVSSNLIFLSAVSVLLIPILFKGLQSAIIEENNLRSVLELEQKKIQQSVALLNEKNQELEQFAYTISHDLKEPLRMICSFMELLDKKYAPQLDEKARKYIHYAVDGATRMTQSINDLLEYSRVGRLYHEINDIESKEIIQEVLQILKSEIEQKDARIELLNLPKIKAVPITFKMLIQNLLTNALKYHEQGNKPEIKISARELPTHWKFSIEDNGIGINPEHYEEIFSIFRRLHTREVYQGTGMGLAISKKITEQHGGQIWVESEENSGSIFYFTIEK